MSVEYMHYVLPREPLRRPSAERIVRLVRTMEAEGWLLSPKSKAFRAMVATGMNFGTGAANGPARKSGGLYDDENCVRWSPQTALPYPLDPAWLRAKKRAIDMGWPMSQVFELGLRYPLTRPPYVREGIYFSFRIQWSRYLLALGGASAPRCRCGESLSLRPEGSFGENAVGPFLSAYRTKCARCGAAFDPKGKAGLYRFALIVDSGKNVPEAGAECRLEPELLSLLERVVGCSFYQLGEVC